DCALLNAGILLESFPKGDITLNDIHRICPHPINPCTVMLNGDELMEVIRVAFTKELTDLPLKGFGFRGKVIGRFTFSGMSVFTRINEHGDETIIKVTKNGSPLKKEKRYLVATIDTFTFGRLLPEIARATTKRYYLPEFMRDLLHMTLKEHFD